MPLSDDSGYFRLSKTVRICLHSLKSTSLNEHFRQFAVLTRLRLSIAVVQVLEY
jgi:hypothetical protein